MSTPKIVTLSQLALLPIGTLVAKIKQGEGGQIDFDIQGYAQTEPLARITANNERFIDLTPYMPELQIDEGKIKAYKSSTSYWLPGNFPHRFIVYGLPQPRRVRVRT
jgi:hypothetical protein